MNCRRAIHSNYNAENGDNTHTHSNHCFFAWSSINEKNGWILNDLVVLFFGLFFIRQTWRTPTSCDLQWRSMWIWESVCFLDPKRIILQIQGSTKTGRCSNFVPSVVQHVIESCFCQEMAVLEKKVPTADWNGMKFVIDFQHVESVTIRKFCISTQGRIMELSTYLDRFCNQSYVSHEKNPFTFHYTGWLIGILMSWFITIPI